MDLKLAYGLPRLKSFQLQYAKHISAMMIPERLGILKSISGETRQKMSESAKRRCARPEWIESQKNRETKLDLDLVKHLYYDEKMSQTEIASLLGVTQKIVFSFMKRHNLPSRTAAKRNQFGERNDSWKGGKRINDQGYVEVYAPNYEHTRPNGYVREHILVAEKMLGRRLKFYSVGDGRNEVVHHINGIKTDNREENLLVLSASDHLKLHRCETKEKIDEVLLNRIRELEDELRNVTKLHFPERGDAV